MEITLTNNFYRYMATMMFGNNTDLGTTATNTRLQNACPCFQPLKATDNTEVTTLTFGSADNDKFNTMGAVSSAKTGNYSELRADIGSGTTKPTKTDNDITALSNTNYTTQTEIKRFVEDDIPKVRYTITITNTSTTDDLTFAEIGLFKNLLSSSRKAYLLGRVVVGETTIAPSNSKVFDIDVTIPS